MTEYSDVFDALDRDWQHFCRRHRRTDLVGAWAAHEPVLSGLRHVAEITALTGTARADALVAVARLHEPATTSPAGR